MNLKIEPVASALVFLISNKGLAVTDEEHKYESSSLILNLSVLSIVNFINLFEDVVSWLVTIVAFPALELRLKKCNSVVSLFNVAIVFIEPLLDINIKINYLFYVIN